DNKNKMFFSFYSAVKHKAQAFRAWMCTMPGMVYGVLGFVALTLSLLLFFEYRFFCTQSERVVEMKEEYRTYLVAVKRVLGDYAKAKERIDELELMLEKKKKNSFETRELNTEQTVFSEDASVYSTDDEDEPEFIVINREPAYLKKGAVSFYKRQKLGHLVAAISDDGWVNYTHHLEKQTAQEKLQQKQKTVRHRRVRRAAPRSLPIIRTNTYADHQVMRDIMLDWPLAHFWLSSRFGARRNPNGSYGFHFGMDMAAPKGTPVKAAAGGVVILAQRVQGYGNIIEIAHNRKYRTRYAHLDEILVRVGRQINRGDLIGKVGDTGRVRSAGKDASHLHFEVSAFGKRLNPMHFLA
ncbi:MAG: M23 family metallopeptidase, partial [Hydrogenophaga sp.]|nr:M23 family metallopeptidase [Hydrogenophaga sp.]